jgi:predicted 3-demethylubiquinone-9 3-methyltransferase (glyoxalase superfamily)
MRKIITSLGFNNQAEAAMNFYTSVFDHSKLDTVVRYGPSGPGPEGSVLTVTGELCGDEYLFINGGPYFKFSPAISHFVKCADREEIDRLWAKLVDGGTVMMELGEYPFAERYGWLADQYGVSWQLFQDASGQSITPFLMFVGDQHGRAEEAMNFYTGIFENSSIGEIVRHSAEGGELAGSVQQATFTLNGQEFRAMDSSAAHNFKFEPGTSFVISCDTQEQIDHFWDAFAAEGTEQQCGWVQDKFGVCWQVVPALLSAWAKDSATLGRVMAAVMKMVKLDLAELTKAAEGN